MIDKALEEVLEESKDDKGFEIKCLNCGSEKCVTTFDVDYDINNEPIYSPFYIICENCGQRSW